MFFLGLKSIYHSIPMFQADTVDGVQCVSEITHQLHLDFMSSSKDKQKIGFCQGTCNISSHILAILFCVQYWPITSGRIAKNTQKKNNNNATTNKQKLHLHEKQLGILPEKTPQKKKQLRPIARWKSWQRKMMYNHRCVL